MSGTPRMDFLLRRLMLLAGELRDALSGADWEACAPVQAEYDEAFAAFRALVDAGNELPHELAGDLKRLAQVHDENVRLALQLRDTASSELDRLTTISRIGAYAPLGANEPGISSRFVDGAA